MILRERLTREFSVPERGIELGDLRDQAVEIALEATRARAIAPSDELVRVCLDGARAATPPNVVWLADALAALKATGDALDWERIVCHLLRLRAALRLRDALVYLAGKLDASVPDAVLQELAAFSPRRREALAHRKAGRSTRIVATRFLHVTATRPLAATMVSVPAYLRDELGLKRRAQVPLELARRAAARLRRRTGAPTRQPPVRAE